MENDGLQIKEFWKTGVSIIMNFENNQKRY